MENKNSIFNKISKAVKKIKLKPNTPKVKSDPKGKNKDIDQCQQHDNPESTSSIETGGCTSDNSNILKPLHNADLSKSKQSSSESLDSLKEGLINNCQHTEPRSDQDLCVFNNPNVANSETAISIHEDLISSELPLECYEGLSSPQIEILKGEVYQEAFCRYPTVYDFCLVSSEEDYEEASKFKVYLSRTFNLTGCMLYDDDTFTLGTDKFNAYANMMDRSTKVFFYMTSNLDNFILRLQSGAVYQTLLSRVKRDKCAPVFPNGECEVPLPLSGLAGLVPHDVPLVERRMKSTFTPLLRNRREEMELYNLKLRKAFYFEELQRRLKKFQEELLLGIEDSQRRAIVGFDPRAEPARAITGSDMNQPIKAITFGGESTLQEADHSSGTPDLDKIVSSLSLPHEYKQAIDKFLTNSTTTNVPSTSVSIADSKKITIGNKNTLIINVVKNGRNLSNVSSSQDEDEEEDEEESEEETR